MSGSITSFLVGSTADLNNAIQAMDIGGADSATNIAYTINFISNFTLTSQLDAINLASGDTLTIHGNGDTINGNGQYNGLFDYAGNVSINNLTFQDTKATGGAGGNGGGSGGGGGAGLGGGLFVGSAGTVTLSFVGFQNDSAAGGNFGGEGVADDGGGGGGLQGGNGGGNGAGGGGGVGFTATGASPAGTGGAGIILGAAGGGSGFGSATAGGPDGGGGGSGLFGGGGGVGGAGGGTANSGGFGGGGGGGSSASGGFGGGGGGGGIGVPGGSGGFGGGGGGGAAGSGGGAGGFGGGGGQAGQPLGSGLNVGVRGGSGGGGLGAGGAIFVQQGGSLTFASGFVTGSSIAGGNGGGSAFGSGMFLQGNEQVTLAGTSAQSLAISDVIADQTGSGGSGDNAGAGSLVIQGPGAVDLSGANTYTGGTTLDSGTLSLQSATAAGTGAITFAADSAATLLVGNGFAPGNTIDGLAPGETIDLAGVGLETTATPGSGNAYTFSGGSSGATLQFDPTQDFSGLTFKFADDGQGGTDVTVVQPPRPSIISGTVANQATTDEATIKPFTSVTITDPNGGTRIDTVSVKPSSSANGSLSDPNQQADGGVYDNGTYLIAGSASQITADLQGLVFTPTAHQVAPGQTVTTGFTVSDGNTAVFQQATDNTTSVVATAVNDPPTITGTEAGQTTTDNTPITPFAGVSITDPDVGVQDSLAIALTDSGGVASDANGTLSGAGLTKTGTGTYALAAASPASLSSELDTLTFTPTLSEVPPLLTVTTGFTVTASQTAGGSTVTTTDSTTSVMAIAAPRPSVISGTVANQLTTDEAAIRPFASVTITDPNLGGPMESVSIRLSSTANGSLSDPNQSADGGVFNNGTYFLSGSSRAVTADLQGLVFTPAAHEVAPGQTVTTGFTLSDLNSAIEKVSFAPATDSTTSVVATAVNDPPAITGTVAGQTTTDTAPVQPFAGVSVTDPDVGAQDSLVITLTGGGGATDANGALSGAGLTKIGTGLYALAATSPANLSSELDALTFTPALGEVPAGQTVTTGFTLTGSQTAGGSTATSTDSATTVITTATLNTVTGPAGGNATLTGTAGADLIIAQGSKNIINGKGGNDIINAGSGQAVVTLGNGDATVTLGGSNNVVVGGTGNTTVTGAPGGFTAVALANGNDIVKVGGSHDVILLGTGTNKVSGTQGMSFITTGAGNDTIILAGSGSIVNAGGGTNTITGGTGHDTFVLPKAGHGFDSITGFSETNVDLLDLRPALAGTTWNGKASTLGSYLKVTDNGGNTRLAIAPTGSGVGTAIATLNGSGNLGLSDLLSHHSLLT